jgi:hypothetical protein
MELGKATHEAGRAVECVQNIKSFLPAILAATKDPCTFRVL